MRHLSYTLKILPQIYQRLKHNTRYHNTFKEYVEMIFFNSSLESDFFFNMTSKKKTTTTTSGTASNLKASVQQRKQSTK